MTTLENEVAVVTGASRGIGKAIAGHLAACGAQVIGTATTAAGSQAITEVLGSKGVGLELDVTDETSVEAFFEAIKANGLGAPTVLVNNAGITRDNLFVRMKDEEWSDVINTNLNSLYRMAKACARSMMKARHGRIINITSVVGAMGNAGQVNYAAAKAGMIGFTKALARELGPRGITVNAVAPGFIDTDMTRELTDETKASLMQQIPLQRLGSVDDIAAAVGFLASAEAGYITGTTLHVNGGMFMG